jgi:hypothetical protein
MAGPLMWTDITTETGWPFYPSFWQYRGESAEEPTVRGKSLKF